MDKIFLPIFCAHLLFYLGFIHASKLITSCNQTPYPEICNYYINTNLVQTLDQSATTFSFRDQSVLVTLNQAIKSHQTIKNLNLRSLDEKSKLAWNDCIELHENTIEHLNRSLSSTNSIDSQTWLSAAIANQQTCQNGFIDLNLNLNLDSMPYMLSNLSKLLSNSLATNKFSQQYSTSTKQITGRRLLLAPGGYPSWVSAADRKLIGAAPKEDIIVAQDGSGDYTTINEAVAAAVGRRKGTGRFVIYVKKGVYKENVEIKRSMKNLMFVGDGIDATVVTGSKNNQDGSTTFGSATFAVSGPGFIAKYMTFENTAGPEKHQAVALRSGSDFSVFYSCSFKGYQDTLYIHSQRQFYRNCDIYGTVDFVFGDAVAVLQNCNIYVRKPMSGQKNTVTAQGRKDPNENTGIVIHNSNVVAASDLMRVSGSFETYLGRPWHEYSRTLFVKCSLDGVINPAGWLPWSGDFALSTLYYGEYMNIGSGSSTGRRVNWPGYHVITQATDVGKFTVGNFLNGNSWIPVTGVPFDSGL
ncbi:pectinesterase [Mercurialis annua]|uniref:pectinesterase n=1 Tax=Mercurialis annua TaxID=3986 RepID=UPI00215E01E1|nr:pectinesterase [Mercurialis annua]